MNLYMENSYKYFKNTGCKFFPCHKMPDDTFFNCLFCFCPLYLLGKDCGGNFRYKNGVKDCTNCTLPHGKGGYEYIMSKMNLVMEKIKVPGENT